MRSEDQNMIRARAERAAEWRAMHRDGEMSETDQRRFMEWLRESPTHVAAYLEILRVEHDLRAAARDWAGTFRPLEADNLAGTANVFSLPQSKQSERATDRALSGTRRVHRWLFAAAACVVALGIGIALGMADGQRFGLPKTYATAHAEQGSWLLPDGSTLHLNSDSEVSIRFNGTERLVTLQRGQAVFQVAKDAARRFRVSAGDTQVIAIGTVFDVYRRPSGTEVVVMEGRVAVLRGSAPENSHTLSLPGATTLDAGEQVVVAPDPASTPHVSHADLRRARAWTQREIVLEASPLSEVVADFNRYSSVPLEIDGEDLKAIRISGVFGAYDVESLLDFVRRMDGVRIEATSTRILILPAEPPLPRPPPMVRKGREPVSSPPGSAPPAG